ncbi:hypothetical protein V8C42DRAFT_338926 [Trichoderma barbatum]
MPLTRAAAKRNASAVGKAKPTLERLSKPSRERKANVTRKTGPMKANKGGNDKQTRVHLSIGSSIPTSDQFGGELYRPDGTKTSLKQLVEESRNGVIVFVYPRPWDDDAYDVYLDFDHAQLDWEPAEMDTIGISPDSASSTAAFVKEKDTSLPLFGNPSGALLKAMSITSSKGNMIQGAFMISKTGVLLTRTTGKHDKIMDNLDKVIFPLIEEMDKE